MKEDIISFAQNKSLPFGVIMCGISYCDGSYKIARPKSELNVIEYIISGKGTVMVNGESFCPKVGDVYFLKQGENHLYYSDDESPWIKIWMNFSGKLADKITECYGLNRQHYFPGANLKKYFDEIYETAFSGIGATAVSEKCAIIFLELCQELSKQAKAEAVTKCGIAERVKNYIDDMADFSQNLEAVASNLSYSKNHIIRAFKAEYGITPYEYMLGRRLEVAESLLKNTAYSVGEIAEKLSFCDSRYFSRFFAERYNISPGEYRKKNKQAENEMISEVLES